MIVEVNPYTGLYSWKDLMKDAKNVTSGLSDVCRIDEQNVRFIQSRDEIEWEVLSLSRQNSNGLTVDIPNKALQQLG